MNQIQLLQNLENNLELVYVCMYLYENTRIHVKFKVEYNRGKVPTHYITFHMKFDEQSKRRLTRIYLETKRGTIDNIN